jgi:hypothetical protein
MAESFTVRQSKTILARSCEAEKAIRVLGTGRPSVHTPKEMSGRTTTVRYLFADCSRTQADKLLRFP